MRQIDRIVKSFRFAGQGIGYLLRTQPNAWVHCCAALLVLVLGVTLGITRAELAVLLLAVGLVLACESFNSAIEAIVDLVSPGYHDLAKVAKDVSAAAVLLAALIAAAIGLVILGPPLLQYAGGSRP